MRLGWLLLALLVGGCGWYIDRVWGIQDAGYGLEEMESERDDPTAH